MIQRDIIEDFFFRSYEFRGVQRDLGISQDNKIISIVGPRRSGKTWYFFYLNGNTEKPMYVNFEDIAFRKMDIEEFFDVIKLFSELKYTPKTLLLDEVQVLKDWETLVRSLYDRGYKVIITGSSSMLLPKEISTQLRGRTLTYMLLPFSFREYLRAKKIKTEWHTYEGRGEILKNLRNYLEYGGYPEVVLTEDKDRILNEYFTEIFYRDFVERHELKSIEFGRFLFEFSFQNFSKEVSMRKFKRFFGKNISDTTLYNYVDKLQDTLSVFFLEKYSPSVYERSSWPKKIYVCDTGIAKILGYSNDWGRKMENTVFLELLRSINYKPLRTIYFYRPNPDGEVDFVINEGVEVKELIQVTYASGKDKIEKREIKALIKASNVLNCKNLKIITWDYEGEEIIEGKKIKYIPLWNWILEQE